MDGYTEQVTNWSTGWLCPDGDAASLYIEKDESGFTLECFSGIPASKIWVDQIDFQYIWGKIPGALPMTALTFDERAITIADYFCSLHCEWVDYSNWKKNS